MAELPGGGVARANTVLLVEDEKAVRQLVTRFLTLNGYRVLAADNSDSARRLRKKHKDTIELLLTDVVMPPGLSGRGVALEFRSQNPALKVLYTSGHNLEASTDRRVFAWTNQFRAEAVSSRTTSRRSARRACWPGNPGFRNLC